MSKRHLEDVSAPGQPPIKKIQFPPHHFGPIATLEEMDIKLLRFQNKKLAQVCRLCCVSLTPLNINFSAYRTTVSDGSRVEASYRAVGEKANAGRCCAQRCEPVLESTQ